jgi:hypothetical protein
VGKEGASRLNAMLHFAPPQVRSKFDKWPDKTQSNGNIIRYGPERR